MHAVLIYDDFGCRPFIEYYMGNPLNSPNDLVVGTDGAIYFTDPPYGLRDQTLNPRLRILFQLSSLVRLVRKFIQVNIHQDSNITDQQRAKY